jgi:ribosomal protein S21
MPTVFLNSERQSIKDVEFALKKLKKKVEAGGILKTLHEKSQYERPGIKRNRKRAAAIMRWRREKAKEELPPKLY